MPDTEGRVFARIDPAVDRRLRLYSTARGERLHATLTALLDRHLPSIAELAASIAKGEIPGDEH
jgi:hypothetical protein